LLFLVTLTLSSYVKELDDTNFEHDTQASTGSTTGDWFILFYAPWCGHCKKVKPIWEELANENHMSERPGKPIIGLVNCDDSSSTCERFSVRSYPTILFI